MSIFQFMGDHPFLTFFIVLLICDMITDCAKALGGKKPK